MINLFILLPIYTFSIKSNITSLSRFYKTKTISRNKSVCGSDVGYIVKVIDQSCKSKPTKTFFAKCPAQSKIVTTTMPGASILGKSTEQLSIQSSSSPSKEVKQVLHVSSIEIALYVLLPKIGLSPSTDIIFDTSMIDVKKQTGISLPKGTPVSIQSINLNMSCAISTRSVFEDETYHSGNIKKKCTFFDYGMHDRRNHKVYFEAFTRQQETTFLETVILLELLQVSDALLRNPSNYALIQNSENMFNIVLFDLLFNIHTPNVLDTSMQFLLNEQTHSIKEGKRGTHRHENDQRRTNKSPLDLFIYSLMTEICNISTTKDYSSFSKYFQEFYCFSHMSTWKNALRNILLKRQFVINHLVDSITLVNKQIRQGVKDNTYCLFRQEESVLLKLYLNNITLRFDMLIMLFKEASSLSISNILSKIYINTQIIYKESHLAIRSYDSDAKLVEHTGHITSTSKLSTLNFGKPKL